MFAYITADRVGTWTGGGSVTANEWKALDDLARELGSPRPDEVISWLICREAIESGMKAHPFGEGEPWVWDKVASFMFGTTVKLAHLYAGTFGECVRKLKDGGAKVSYTAAAHSIVDSHIAHKECGVPFNYPHLTDTQLWERYVRGYREADVVVCPSQHSKECMQAYGCKNVFIIPHGTDLPEKLTQPPRQFVVGYMGNCFAPDKGVRTLLRAWKKLNYRDGLLMLAGQDSGEDYVHDMVHREGGGNVVMTGWVRNKSSFFNGLSLYVQPSITEGFGLEVLEAMAHGRAVIASTGCGAADLIPNADLTFRPGDVDALAELIDIARQHWDFEEVGLSFRDVAANYTWDKVRGWYQDLWKELLR